jgi:hypothetical protein
VAEFCAQCGNEYFWTWATLDFYFTEPCENGEGYQVICEGCGHILVDENGVCLGGEGCEKDEQHKKEYDRIRRNRDARD